MTRDAHLRAFVDAALAAFGEAAPGPEARVSLERIAAALAVPTPRRERPGSRLAVQAHLEGALAVKTESPALRRLIEAFRRIEPDLEWVRRADHDRTASADFAEGHANAMILGPGGLEHRRDVWIGVSLLAPRVRYPDHSHAPEETYLVLSDGEFRQGGGAWFTPGVGGSFYNVPDIVHAMRAKDTPLLAFWALWAGPDA